MYGRQPCRVPGAPARSKSRNWVVFSHWESDTHCHLTQRRKRHYIIFSPQKMYLNSIKLKTKIFFTGSRSKDSVSDLGPRDRSADDIGRSSTNTCGPSAAPLPVPAVRRGHPPGIHQEDRDYCFYQGDDERSRCKYWRQGPFLVLWSADSISILCFWFYGLELFWAIWGY